MLDYFIDNSLKKNILWKIVECVDNNQVHKSLSDNWLIRGSLLSIRAYRRLLTGMPLEKLVDDYLKSI